jgi:cell division protein FtsI (penicillin-binding protein 3)
MRNRFPRAVGEPKMGRRIHKWRLTMLAALIAAGFCALGARLVDLQVFRHEELSLKAGKNTGQEYVIEPRRGDILDAKGNLLATSVFVKTVCADPSLIGDHYAEVAHALAPILQLDEAGLAARLQPKITLNDKGALTTNQYVVLKQKVPFETWAKIQETMRDLPLNVDEKNLTRSQRAYYRYLRSSSVFTERKDDQLRVYPNQNLGSHVLGFVGRPETPSGQHMSDTVGKDGIERTFNRQLTGSRGWRVTERDNMSRELVARREQDVQARDGLNVVLTIDSVVQHILESALAEANRKHSPISISGLVVRPRTGEIVAMATLPDFDPNEPGQSDDDARRNRVVADLAEPGSTFKVVIVSSALSDGTVKLTDLFDCEHGRFYFGGRTLRDHGSHGVLPVQDIIKKSSNIGAGKVAIKMGPDRVYSSMRDFGFGSVTGIVLPGEVAGIVHPVKKWSKVSIVQMAMGHGVAVTPLQMTMAVAAIANKGVLMRPMLVNRLEDADHHIAFSYSPMALRRVISQKRAPAR